MLLKAACTAAVRLRLSKGARCRINFRIIIIIIIIIRRIIILIPNTHTHTTPFSRLNNAALAVTVATELTERP